MSDSLPDQDREQRIDRYWAAIKAHGSFTDRAVACIALADREQAELRAEVERLARAYADQGAWRLRIVDKLDAARAEAAGLRERLTRAEAFERRIRDLFSGGLEVPLADLRAALSADENGTRDE